MLTVGIVSTMTVLYLGLLFAVAYYADNKRKTGQSIIANPYVYSLSLAVHYTSWTFYGVIGLSATNGIAFLALYLGNTLMAFSWWFLLRKMVRISKEQHITSIADFISSRYGKSPLLGGIVTVFSIMIIIPFIALQLKAVAYTFDLLTVSPGADGFRHMVPALPESVDTAFIVAVFLGIFGILFGARHLDARSDTRGLWLQLPCSRLSSSLPLLLWASLLPTVFSMVSPISSAVLPRNFPNGNISFSWGLGRRLMPPGLPSFFPPWRL